MHKKDVPLHTILLMTNSAQHQLAQWLTPIIDPVHSYTLAIICQTPSPLKMHKKDVPFHTISSMTSSAQHQLAQWLTPIIDPVHLLYSGNYMSDSFTFADLVRTADFDPSVFPCLFEISNLFTNVPLATTINICVIALYNSKLNLPHFHVQCLLNLCKWSQLQLNLLLMPCTNNFMV